MGNYVGAFLGFAHEVRELGFVVGMFYHRYIDIEDLCIICNEAVDE